jgi:Tfp pilus assembly protein PilZ
MDRRQTPRIPDSSSAAVTILSAPSAPEIEGQTFFCLAANISEGGLMIRVGVPVPQGSIIEARVAFKEPIRSFNLVGRVAWVDPHGVPGHGFSLGIEFTSGNGRDLESWREVVNKKALYHGADELTFKPGADGDNA